MVHFLAHVSQCYTEIAQPFSECLVELLDMHATILHPQLRMQLLQALMHMRHKKILNAEPILALCFRLSSCHDKMLRATLHSYIIQDIKLANSKSRNDRLNKSIQNYLYRVIEVCSNNVLISICGSEISKTAAGLVHRVMEKRQSKGHWQYAQTCGDVRSGEMQGLST